MTRSFGPASALSAAILAFLALAPAVTQAQSADVTRGRLLTQRYCAGCHSVGRSGVSPHTAAPPFRDLHQRYQIDSLAEALAEGILVGHPAMPEMRFPPEDVKAILAYIKSVQTEAHADLDDAPADRPQPARSGAPVPMGSIL